MTEVVHAKGFDDGAGMPGGRLAEIVVARGVLPPILRLMWGYPAKKLLFQWGQEFGPSGAAKDEGDFPRGELDWGLQSVGTRPPNVLVSDGRSFADPERSLPQ